MPGIWPTFERNTEETRTWEFAEFDRLGLWLRVVPDKLKVQTNTRDREAGTSRGWYARGSGTDTRSLLENSTVEPSRLINLRRLSAQVDRRFWLISLPNQLAKERQRGTTLGRIPHRHTHQPIRPGYGRLLRVAH